MHMPLSYVFGPFSFRTLTYPFDVWTWIALGVSILAIAAALYLLKFEELYVMHTQETTSYEIFSITVITLISESLPLTMLDMRHYSRWVQDT